MQSDLGPHRNQNTDVSFRPLHSGLGFHPFSDGLPYAPQQKPKSPTPQRAPEVRAAPQAQTQARQTPTPPRPPLAGIRPETEQLGVSYLFVRGAAYTLDLLVHTSLLSGIVGLTFWLNEVDPRILLDTTMIPIFAVALLGLNWFLVAFQEVLFRSSLGKSLFSLVLRGSRTKILLRAILFIPSALIGAGLVLGFFNRKRRCLHDALFNLQPLRAKPF
jgi:hypothetical protein